MLKSQKGFHVLPVLIILLVVGVSAFAIFKISNNKGGTPSSDRRGPSYQALRPCGKEPLNTMITDLSRLDRIAPLGGINTPDHTLPTDHMYMMYPYGDSSQKDIFAPADIVVTSVSYGSQTENGKVKSSDYAMNFYPCKELKIILGHIDTLDGALASVGDLSADPSCTTSTQTNSVIKHCMKDVDIKIPAGELLGTADGWDLWATYEGTVSPKVISPAYYHNIDAVCPLDYFTSDLRHQLYAKLKRTAEPKCGEAYQDKAGTLQGGWFAHQDPNKAKTDWGSHFSLAHDSEDSSVGMVAVAGTIASHFMYRFTPTHSGTINREPSETTTGTVYCYEHTGDRRFPNGVMAGPGKVVLKLTDDHTMQIEHKDGTCSASETLSNPTTYYR